jgi:hypothetical protein
MLIMWEVLQEVSCDADDNGGAGPYHEVGAASEGLQWIVESAHLNHFSISDITIREACKAIKI